MTDILIYVKERGNLETILNVATGGTYCLSNATGSAELTYYDAQNREGHIIFCDAAANAAFYQMRLFAVPSLPAVDVPTDDAPEEAPIWNEVNVFGETFTIRYTKDGNGAVLFDGDNTVVLNLTNYNGAMWDANKGMGKRFLEGIVEAFVAGRRFGEEAAKMKISEVLSGITDRLYR